MAPRQPSKPSVVLGIVAFLSNSCLSPPGYLGFLDCTPSMYASLLVFSASLLGLASADVTIYGLTGQTTVDPELALGGSTYVPEPTTTSYVTTHGPPQYTGLAAYNPVYMYPPAIPEPPPANQFAIGVPNDAALMEGLSVRQQGNFFGFSIEMSVVNQLSKS